LRAEGRRFRNAMLNMMRMMYGVGMMNTGMMSPGLGLQPGARNFLSIIWLIILIGLAFLVCFLVIKAAKDVLKSR
jgi:hypothetical protein